MRIKVDEDLPKAAVQMLRDRGYEALSVIEQGMGGLKDPPCKVDHLLNRWATSELDTISSADEYAAALTDLLMGDFRKNFLGVHRRLAKAIGLVSPRKGPRICVRG